MNPPAHWHWPETQLWPVEQLLSQLPQCWALLARSKQPALHSVWLAPQAFVLGAGFAQPAISSRAKTADAPRVKREARALSMFPVLG
jgi:hypothetical protein